MGCGKTTSIINLINASDQDTKFLYITPYLTEVERVIEGCPDKKFCQPKEMGTKKRGIKKLFERGSNIVSTHALFRCFDKEIIDLAYSGDYVLIMDEVADVVSPLDITQDDADNILEKYTEVVDGNTLRWMAPSYEGKFEGYKRLCDLGCICIYGDNTMLQLFPISTFSGFKEIYILTYLFDAQIQKYYFDYYGVEYDYLYVTRDGNKENSYQLTREPQSYDYSRYSQLISIFNNEKLNKIGEMNGSLSKGWYERNQNNRLMTTLKNNLSNFFKNYTKTGTNQNLWTTFKKYQSILKGKGYTKGFLSSNARATNEYKDRTAVAYCLNRYFNPVIKNFFIQKGVEVDEDAYALSEMLQFIFRSAIREGRSIQVYIPSKRMRALLEAWLVEINKGN